MKFKNKKHDLLLYLILLSVALLIFGAYKNLCEGDFNYFQVGGPFLFLLLVLIPYKKWALFLERRPRLDKVLRDVLFVVVNYFAFSFFVDNFY